MKITKKIFFILFFILLLFGVISKAKDKIDINVDNRVIQKNQAFNVTIGLKNEDIAAYTIWVFYDSDVVSVSQTNDNINVVGNKIIATGVSNTGKNIQADNLINLQFKAKQEGKSIIYAIGEFYKEDGKKADIQYNEVEITVGNVENEQANVQDNSIQNQIVDNTNLDIFRLDIEGINPDFNNQITDYYITVKESVDNIEVTAIPENKNTKVEVLGNNNLKNGLNIIEVIVTSEDVKSKKTYKVYVTKTNNEENANADLETLAVEFNNIFPEFQSNITNYSLEVGNNVENLNILAIPNNKNGIVQVEGNEKINIGKNMVYITVTAPNKVTKKIYSIEVYRRNSDEEATYNNNQEKSLNESSNTLKRMSSEGNYEPIENDETIDMHKEEQEKQELVNKKNEAKNKIFVIAGSIISILIMGIVIIRISCNTKTELKIKKYCKREKNDV